MTTNELGRMPQRPQIVRVSRHAGLVGSSHHGQDPDQLPLLELPVPAATVEPAAPRSVGLYLVRDLAAELAANPAIAWRFWSKVWTANGDDSECWLWVSSLNGASADGRSGAGYGNLHIKYDKHPVTGKLVEWVAYAHHVSWLLAGNADLTPGQVLRHSCDERSCANPHHLSVGTKADNYWDFRLREFEWRGPMNDPRGPGRRAADIREALRAAGADDYQTLLLPDSADLDLQRAAVAKARQAGFDQIGQGTLLPDDELAG
ncbi:hypothetical protein BCF44_12255 [Kutzneria buriramensis]|uniref:HNH endonuclease n=1 Tax=Kutzneria buriramensis TaxID=1045776 RepID=A0A3E0GYA1_9PSEU|nr:hypothetical protein BCF44_12255 [Kutzneria buriramensis]